MMPMTPSGTATRSIASPFGLVHEASTRPTGSGRSAIASSPAAIASTPLGIECEAVAQCRREALALGLGDIAGIGVEDLGLPGPHRPRGFAQCHDLGLGRGESKGGGRRAGAAADLGHRRR